MRSLMEFLEIPHLFQYQEFFDQLIIALSGTVVKITQNYLARKLHGSAAPPLLSAGETI